MAHLAVVPCSKEKAWDDVPALGAVPAGEAYTSRFHRLTRRYAARFADRIVILSAKYGFLDPTDEVPGPYDVTFERPADPVIGLAALRQQVRDKGLDAYDRVSIVCPADYEARVRASLADVAVEIDAPLRGQADLEAMTQWLLRALTLPASRRGSR